MNLLNPEYLRWCRSQYEAIRARRNAFRGKPDPYDRLEIELDRMFESFYRSVLNGRG
jgi:hypothetical protein